MKRHWIAVALVCSASAGCEIHTKLTAAQSEADLVARFVEARGCLEYTLVRRRNQRRSPLAQEFYSSFYTASTCGETFELAIDCYDGPEIPDPLQEGLSPRCHARGFPAVNQNIRSWFAPELIALQDRMRLAFSCEVDTFEIRRGETEVDGTRRVRVRACGQERTFRVACPTLDSTLAASKCSVVAL